MSTPAHWWSLLLAVALTVFGLKAAAQSSRLLAVTGTGQGNGLCEVNIGTAVPQACHGNWPTLGAVSLGLVWAHDSVYALEYGPDPIYRLVKVNPADGSRSVIGEVLTGQPAIPITGFCSHPVTQELFLVGYPDGFTRNLYHVDPLTAATSVAVPGVYGWVGNMTCMVIDPNGDGWFFTQSNRLWSFNVASGVAFHHGYVLGLPSPTVANAAVAAMACREPGVLYADVRTGASQTIESGLFRIDIATLTAARLSDTLTAGLTFAPGVNAVNYCTPKLNSLGCTPSIGAHGYASVSAVEGLDVWGSNALNNTSGLLLFGASGRNALPWNGGTLCVKPPLVRTPVRSSGGDSWPAQNCSGRWSLDLNAALSMTPGYPAGTTLDLQWFGRDPGFAPPGNFQLSNGLELTLRP